MEEYMLPCLSKTLLGIECFGCGTQRAFVLLCKGDFTAAFHMFPAIYTLIPFLFVISLNFIDKTHNYHRYIVGLGIINAVVMVVSYFIKHLYL